MQDLADIRRDMCKRGHQFRIVLDVGPEAFQQCDHCGHMCRLEDLRTAIIEKQIQLVVADLKQMNHELGA